MQTTVVNRRTALLGAGFVLSGCTIQTDYNHDAADAPLQQIALRNSPTKNIWGVSAKELELMAMDLGVADMGRLAITGDGKFAGNPIANIVNQELISRCGTREMQKLPIAFAAVAIEKESRRAVLFNHGDAGVAVQASCAIEGIFTPVRIRGKQRVDADQVALWHKQRKLRQRWVYRVG